MPSDLDPVLDDNVRCIAQVIDLISALPAKIYATESEEALGASIGGHVRHNIDHYISFLRQAGDGRIDYDERQRESAAETDPGVAYQRLRAISCALSRLSGADLEKQIDVRMNCGQNGEWSNSTVRRELQFLLSHSVHHYAIIAMICRTYGHDVPEDFGVAPSTLQYRDSLTSRAGS